tara:strand:+ start:2597 stop:3388 length:792 start_codon:yes stop_codon:yes gene_type:complete
MFKIIRSFLGKLLPENLQMKVIIFLSNFFWFLRKYFLGSEIEYPKKFLENWQNIKKNSSQDIERNFTIYQLIKIHNEIFKDDHTNIIEFGTDRGGTITTISKFVKPNTNIYALDSFGNFANEIKKNVTNFDTHYQGSYEPFTKKTRFKDFNYRNLQNNLNEEIKKKNCKLEIICCHFPDSLNPEEIKILKQKKYSFVHFDFDLYKPTKDAIKFVFSNLEKNAVLLFDDYNMINQDGVKPAVLESEINFNKCFQTSSGQLICFT